MGFLLDKMVKLTNEHKKTLERLLKESKFVFSEKNKSIFTRKISKTKSGLLVMGLNKKGYNTQDYTSKFANIYSIDEYNIKLNKKYFVKKYSI